MRVCMYVYACPIPHCIITFVRYIVQKSILYVRPPPPLNSVTSLRLSPLYLVFHRTNTLLTFGPTITYILVTLFFISPAFCFIVHWLVLSSFP